MKLQNGKTRIIIDPDDRSCFPAKEGDIECTLPGKQFMADLESGEHQITLHEFGWCVGDDPSYPVLDSFKIVIK